MREAIRRRGVVFAAATGVVLGAFAHCWAGIAYDSSSRVNLTHDADVSNAVQPLFSTGRIPVPKSVDIFPVNPYQMDHTFTSGSANTIAIGSLGRITNATTASFVLATGTGVTQTDPINAYPGESSLRFDVDLSWNVSTGGFGPLANGFASLNTGVVVGTGGSAELHINLNFVNEKGDPLRTAWVVDKSWATAGTFTDTFSTSRVLGGGALPAGSELHILGSIEFQASNAESPSRFDALRAEFGGTPPTGVYKTDAQGSYFDSKNWEQATFNPNEPGLLPLPNGIGQRAWFGGTTAGQSHTVGITDNITLGTLDIGGPSAYNFTGTAPITWAAQQGEAVLNVRGVNGSHSFTNPMILSSTLDTIVEGNSLLTLSGPISGSQGITKFGAGTLVLNAANNSYSGPTIINEGKIQFIGNAATPITLNPGTSLDASGLIRNFVTARSFSHIAPGINGIGNITFEGLTLDPDSILDIEGAGASFDTISLAANDTAAFKDGKVNLIARSAFEPGTYPIIHYNGTPLGDLSGKLSLLSRYHGGMWASLRDDAETRSVVLSLASIPQWNFDGNGVWGSAGNWSPTVVPSGPAGIAGFLGKITLPRTLTVDGARTIGSMIFDNPNQYTISGGSLTVGDSSNPGAIEVARGSHLISTPLTFAGDTQINIANGQALTLSLSTTSISANQNVTKVGDGTLTIAGKFNAGAGSQLTVEGGTVNLNTNPGVFGTGGLTLNITGSKVIAGTSLSLRGLSIGYGAAGSQTLDLRSQASAPGFRAVRVYSANLDATKADLWNAIISANQPGAADQLDGITDTQIYANGRIGIAKMADHVLIRSTRIGDVNLDGSVTISDFIDLASHFNQVGNATWQEGDLNYDRNVTIADFIDLASNFGSSYTGEILPISAADAATLAAFAQEHGASVPEPAVGGLAMMSMGLMWRHRRGRRWTNSLATI
jgi:autotransporter-associated beta strand protein